MRVVTLIVRMLFGLAFTTFGLNGILMLYGKDFIPQPEGHVPSPGALAFMKAMTETGYMMALISGTQLVAGLMILSGVWVPLGLTLLAPVIVNIVLFHWYIEPQGMGVAWAVLAVELFLAFAYGPSFRGVLDPVARSRWSTCPPPAK